MTTRFMHVRQLIQQQSHYRTLLDHHHHHVGDDCCGYDFRRTNQY